MSDRAGRPPLIARKSFTDKFEEAAIKIGSHPLQVLTVVGLLIYGGSLLTYARFYGAFGVRQEEVGLDYAATLTRALTAFANWLVLLLVILGCVVMALAVIQVVWWFVVWLIRLPFRLGRQLVVLCGRLFGKRGTTTSGRAATEALEDNTDGVSDREVLDAIRRNLIKGIAIAGCVLLAFVVLFEWTAMKSPQNLADKVKSGGPIQPPSDEDVDSVRSAVSYVVDLVYRNPLRIRVELMTVSPAHPGEKLPAGLETGRTYAYLGGTGDTVILYDNGRTLRVPRASVSLSDADENLPDS